MAYRPIEIPRRELITPEKAQWILENENYERQRKLDQTYIEEYALLMDLGAFRQDTMLSAAILNGKRRFVNGQHTLGSIVFRDNDLEVLVQEYECDSEQDIQDLYGTFDHGKERSWEQLIDAADLPSKLELSPTETRCLNGALPYLVGGFVSNPAARYNAGELLHSMRIREPNMIAWKTEAHEYFKIMQSYDGILHRRLCITSVCAIGLVTYRHCPDLAKAFWENLDIGDESDYRAGFTGYLEAKKWSKNHPQVRSRTAADAWNQWIKNTEHPPETSKQASVTPSKKTRTPLLLLKTPHDGKKILHYATLTGTPVHEPMAWEDSQ